MMRHLETVAVAQAATPDKIHIVPETVGGRIADPIATLLRAVREHLGMDLAFVAEFLDGRRVFRYVDAMGEEVPIGVGDSDPLEETYCNAVVAGRLPEIIPDTAAEPFAAGLAVTRRLDIGSYLSLPIRLADGSVFGTYCCFNHAPDPTMDERDLQMLRVFADVTATHIDRMLDTGRALEKRAMALRDLLAPEPSWMAYQPIVELATDRVIGVESLSRFPSPPLRAADEWFAEAAAVGMGDAFEAASIRRALTALPSLPAGISLNVNCAPAVILSGDIVGVLAGHDLSRIVLEVTEHQPIEDYDAFQRIIGPLRAQGLRIAVDDAGAGYATFRHILQLRPDIIKLDISLTTRIDVDVDRRALAAAIIRFALETGMMIVAEGVETTAQLECLKALGAHTAQGYLLGRAEPLDEIIKRL